jgi:hypothetical protein
MNKVFKTPQMKTDFRYSTHDFKGKSEVIQLQCADLLAWHWFTHNRRIREGKGKRKDFRSLLGKKIYANHCDKEGIDTWLAHRKMVLASSSDT